MLEAHQLIDGDQRVARPARELRGVFPDRAVRLRRPETPLATTTLLTLGHGEPRIGHELACEISEWPINHLNLLRCGSYDIATAFKYLLSGSVIGTE